MKWILFYLAFGGALLLFRRVVSWPLQILVGLMLTNVAHAQTDAFGATYSQISNMIACVNGKLLISHIECGTPGIYYQQKGVAPAEILYFQASYQSNTFYVRRLWGIESNSVIETTNGFVYGANANGKWMIKGKEVYWSVSTNTATNTTSGEDAIRREISIGARLAAIPLRMGFPQNIDPVSLLSPTQLLCRMVDGKEVIAALALGPDGIVRTVGYGITNSDVHANVVLEYEYEGTSRPRWMPSMITVSADEMLMKNQKHLNYSEIHRVRSCTLGERDLPDGFTPDMFLAKSDWLKVIAWTNGTGFVSEGD